MEFKKNHRETRWRTIGNGRQRERKRGEERGPVENQREQGAAKATAAGTGGGESDKKKKKT